MITVLLFAQLQEAAGTDRIELDGNGWTIKDLKEKLASDYNLPSLDRVMIAINEEYSSDEDNISTGDTVAIIPPVSGG